MQSETRQNIWSFLDTIRGKASPSQYLSRVMTAIEQGELSVSPREVPDIVLQLAKYSGNSALDFYVPTVVTNFIEQYLAGRTAARVLDPAAGLGTLISAVQYVTGAPDAVGIDINPSAIEFSKALNPTVKWQLGDSRDLLKASTGAFDVIACSLPLAANDRRTISVGDGLGSAVSIRDNVGFQILALSATKLSDDGVGIFVTTRSFFWSRQSPFRQLERLGISVHAALELPAGVFAPYTNAPTYIVVVNRRRSDRVFVGQLSADIAANAQVIENLRLETEGETIEEGRFAYASTFTGLLSVRVDEQFREAGKIFGFEPKFLYELTKSYPIMGKSTEDFVFEDRENCIYVPTIGNSDVVVSVGELSLKKQNYLQLEIDEQKSDAKFVARFLNSELGRSLREASKSGDTIPHFTMEAIKTLRLFVPPIEMQLRLLEVETKISAERNRVLGIDNELADLQRELWTNPRKVKSVDSAISAFSDRFSKQLEEQAQEGIDRWMESLPYPLAAILRAWYATSERDSERKYTYLLRFFEASAEFMSIVLLSAFASRPYVFETLKPDLKRALGSKDILNPDFGTWMAVFEFFSKRVREYLNSGQDGREFCSEIFCDLSNKLPEMLGRQDVGTVLRRANVLRNSWSHEGVAPDQHMKELHVQIDGVLQAFREAIGDGWANVELVRAKSCVRRRGTYQNEVSQMKGSNPSFITIQRDLNECLEVESLHFLGDGSKNALSLLPLVQLGPTPKSTKTACYFFNGVESGQNRLVAYQFADEPKVTADLEDVSAALQLITSD